MANLLIGIDLGGTNIKIGCFDTHLKVLKKTSITTDADTGPQAVVERMIAAIGGLVKESGFTLSDISAACQRMPAGGTVAELRYYFPPPYFLARPGRQAHNHHRAAKRGIDTGQLRD